MQQTQQKFTGKERDTETGLDYFGARYFSGAQGRFTSTDPVWVKGDRVIDPQRLNLYSYGRNNPLRFSDPTGMDIIMGTCGSDPVSVCEARLKEGLKKEDRSHVHVVKGDGKDGYKKGQYYVMVDKDYKSDSKNFQTLQSLSNDRSATGMISVLDKGQSTNIMSPTGWNSKTGTQWGTAAITMNAPMDPFNGYTFFQFRGKEEPGVIHSAGDYSEVVVNGTQSDIGITAAMHHEVRHLFLGDFGRTASKAVHSPTFNMDDIPRNNADRETKDAADEATANASK